MNIFDYEDYKKYVNFRVSQLPKKGRGYFLKMANFLAVSSVTVSQIFKGDRNLTVEQACELSEYFGFTELESDYFVALVEHERAGSHKLKKLIQRRLESLKAKSSELKHRLRYDKQISEEAKATFYSQWFYSASRLLTAVAGHHTPEEISRYLDLPIKQINEVLQFLAANGLCREKNGLYHIGPTTTHIGADHPLASRHHINWRLQSIERISHLSASELCFTLPNAISDKYLKLIRKELVDAIEKISKLVTESPAETLTCLNIDLFKVRKNS